VNDHLKNVFRVMEAHRFLTVYESEQAAITSFQTITPSVAEPEAVAGIVERVHDEVRVQQEAAN
jgi:hypothetical protein